MPDDLYPLFVGERVDKGRQEKKWSSLTAYHLPVYTWMSILRLEVDLPVDRLIEICVLLISCEVMKL